MGDWYANVSHAFTSERQLKTVRNAVDWDDMGQRNFVYRTFCRMILNWQGVQPNLHDIFHVREMDWLLMKDIAKGYALRRKVTPVLDFALSIAYRDRSELNARGEFVQSRHTAVHFCAHALASDHDSQPGDVWNAEQTYNYYRDAVHKLFRIYDNYRVNYEDGTGLTHLHAACQYEATGVVACFLVKGHDPNWSSVDSMDASPLHVAMAWAHESVVDMLLSVPNINPNLGNDYGFTPLHMACMGYRDGSRVVEHFIRMSEIIDNPVWIDALPVDDEIGQTPLEQALHHQLWEVAKVLLKYGAQPAKILCPLRFVCMRYTNAESEDEFDREDHTTMMELLLRHGADANSAYGWDNLTPLHCLCLRSYDMMRRFFEVNDELGQRVELDPRDREGRTPLFLAVSEYRRDLAELLLARGADPNVPTVDGTSVLHLVCQLADDYDYVNSLFDQSHPKFWPLRIDTVNASGTVVHEVLERGDERLAELLLRRGDGSADAADRLGFTVLHRICLRYRDARFLELFFGIHEEHKRPVNLNARDTYGRAPLHIAFGLRAEPIAELLLRRGADPNAADVRGSSVLHYICQRGSSDEWRSVEMLLRVSAEMNVAVRQDARDDIDWTPLQWYYLSNRNNPTAWLMLRYLNEIYARDATWWQTFVRSW